MTDDQHQLVLDRRRDQLETDIKSALNFLHGTDLVVRLLHAADSYAGKCCEAATASERHRIIRLASQLRAAIPADHPKGAQASFADYLRVTEGDTS